MQQEINDIGTFSTTFEEYGSFANKLPVGQRYSLIKSHLLLSIKYKFPTLSNAIASSVVYGPSGDGVFCRHYPLMIPMHCRKDKGGFVNMAFKNGHKLQEKGKRQVNEVLSQCNDCH